MAKSGPKVATSTRGELTRQSLMDATRESLAEVGFSQTSAREIARRAGCSQAALFYHWPSVPDVMIDLLSEISQRRRAAFEQAMAGDASPAGVISAARQTFSSDVASGDLRVLVEVITGARAIPGMSSRVAQVIAPWREIATDALARIVPVESLPGLSSDLVGRVLVGGFLGMELMAMLDEDDAATRAVFDHVEALIDLVGRGEVS